MQGQRSGPYSGFLKEPSLASEELEKLTAEPKPIRQKMQKTSKALIKTLSEAVGNPPILQENCCTPIIQRAKQRRRSAACTLWRPTADSGSFRPARGHMLRSCPDMRRVEILVRIAARTDGAGFQWFALGKTLPASDTCLLSFSMMVS